MVSFLKKDEEESSSLWDWIIFALIILAVGGFWGYYRFQKTKTLQGFEKADMLYKAREYQKALDVYEELKGSDYLESKHDSLLTIRLDTLYSVLNISKPE